MYIYIYIYIYARLYIPLVLTPVREKGGNEMHESVRSKSTWIPVLSPYSPFSELGAKYCTPEINTSEIIVDFEWHFPMNFQWHFPKDCHFPNGCSVVCSNGFQLL